jgi:hypothetical protein
MPPEKIIAERSLDLDMGTEPPSAIRVIVGKPEELDEGEWVAPYEIHGPGPGEVWAAGARGVDAMQALQLTLWVLPHELERFARRGRLTWEGSADLGFTPPTPP